MNKFTFLTKQPFPILSFIKQTIIRKALLSALFLAFLNIPNLKAGDNYYQKFDDDNYEVFIEKNELLGDQIGLKNKITGKIILKAQYDDIVSIYDKHVRVIKNNKWGIVDTLGKVIIPLSYARCSNLRDGRIFLTNSADKIALANSAGLLLTKYLYDDFRYFRDGLAEVKQNNQYGFINKEGLTIIPIKYASVGIPMAGKITAKTNSYHTVILGTVPDEDRPWTQRPNDVTFKEVNNYVLDYSGRVMFASKDHITNVGNGYVMTFTEHNSDCALPDGWSAFELYDKAYKKLISYKACWQTMVAGNFMIVKNGSSNKYGVYPVLLADGNFKLEDFIKTPYTGYEDKIFKDAEGYQYIKFFKDGGAFVYIGMDGKCYQFEGSSSCE